MYKFCEKCGHEIIEDSLFCGQCGFKFDLELIKRMNSKVTSPGDKNDMIEDVVENNRVNNRIEFNNDNIIIANNVTPVENPDIILFLNNLESANPILPPVNINNNMLDINEKGLYRLDNIHFIKGSVGQYNEDNRFKNLNQLYDGTLIVSTERILLEEYPDSVIFYNQITSMEFLDETLIINVNYQEESFILLGIEDNMIDFNIGDRQHNISFTPQMLYNLIKGQILR